MRVMDLGILCYDYIDGWYVGGRKEGRRRTYTYGEHYKRQPFDAVSA